nr:hypothetical protein CJLB15_00049 [Campylobacter phage CJLB-15]
MVFMLCIIHLLTSIISMLVYYMIIPKLDGSIKSDTGICY